MLQDEVTNFPHVEEKFADRSILCNFIWSIDCA